jgi:hypothetical protein
VKDQAVVYITKYHKMVNYIEKHHKNDEKILWSRKHLNGAQTGFTGKQKNEAELCGRIKRKMKEIDVNVVQTMMRGV